jgi:translation initiation factor IF-1
VTRRRALILAVVASLLGGGAAADELTFVMRVEHGRVPDAMRRIRVKQGDIVRLRWTTDQPGTLHVHGYDIERRLVPGTVTDITLTARATGRFPIHLHGPAEAAGGHDHDDIVTLEVYPR